MATSQPNAQATEVFQRYNLRSISFADMEQLGRELVAAGALPQDKLLDFIPLRPGGIRVDGGHASFAADVPVDMIQRQRDIVDSQVSAGIEQRLVDYSRSVLRMYEAFASPGRAR